jgi:hypothetical protein
MEDLLHGPHDVLERAGVRRGDEDDGQVGAFPHPLEHLTGDLTHRVGGDGMFTHR